MVRHLSKFQWSLENTKIILSFILTSMLVFCNFYWLPDRLAMAIGICTLFASSVYSIRTLLYLATLNVVPRPVLKVLKWFRLVEAPT
jgi:PST family polysaccharide transporter